MKRSGSYGRWGRCRWALVPLVGVLLGVVSAAPAGAQVQPTFACPASGFLFQSPGAGGPTSIQVIDMATGDTTAGPVITGREINAAGYNVLDDYMYGFDNTDGSEAIVRIGADGSVTTIPVPAPVDTGLGHLTGEVDGDGHYWLSSTTDDWYEIDLVPGSSAYGEVLDSGSWAGDPALAGLTGGNDWAMVPGAGDFLYRVMRDVNSDSEGVLVRFDMAAHTWEALGALGPLGDNGTGAGVYADADGFLYASDNGTGQIFRIDIEAVTATFFAQGPVTANNDATRCALAPMPIDYGDAPDSYGTRLADDGPRHAVPEYDSKSHTAPLMLGSTVDVERDGFPSWDADGDDIDDTDDEDGVSGPIVAGSGGPTTVSVTATNDTAEPATLAGWIDLDGNGTFDADELATATVPASSGTADHDLVFPAATTTDATHARFRLFPDTATTTPEAAPAAVIADPLPTGSAAAGEVEDYLVQVGTYDVTKTSDPPDGTTVRAGQTITYTITITNTDVPGPVDRGGAGLSEAVDGDITDITLNDDLSGVLDDATLLSGPIVSPTGAGTATIDDDQTLTFTGDVAVGTDTTITYAVTVLDPAEGRGDAVLTNAVTAPGATTCECTSVNPVESYTIAKTTDPAQPTAAPGQTVAYTLTITNNGAVDLDPTVTDELAGVLDDATYNNDVTATAGAVTSDETRLVWTGPLAVDDTVTVTYSVTINDPLTADTILRNIVTGTGPNSCPCGTTTHVITPAAPSPITPGPLPVVG
jgi:uncharacterized repeat protein (TIGR01451 family)